MSADLFGETPAAPAPVVSLRDMIASVGREVRMRESAYPKWVKAGRMTAGEAAAELARMRRVLDLLAAIEAPTPALLDALAAAAWNEARRFDLEEDASEDSGPWPPTPGAFGWQEDDSAKYLESRPNEARAVLVALAEAVR